MTLPAPQPAPVDFSAFGISGQQQPATRRHVDMRTYYNAAGGCFTADATVTMANGLTKRVAELWPGDRVLAFRRETNHTNAAGTMTSTIGVARVRFVAETALSSPALLVTLPQGLQLTAWHPILVPTAQQRKATDKKCLQACEWAFPAEIAAAAGVVVDDDTRPSRPQPQALISAAHAPLSTVPTVFNLALEEEANQTKPWHGVFLCGVPTITLGHGIVGDRVASHAYFGSRAVVEDLERLPRNTRGRVMLDSTATTARVTPLSVRYPGVRGIHCETRGSSLQCLA